MEPLIPQHGVALAPIRAEERLPCGCEEAAATTQRWRKRATRSKSSSGDMKRWGIAGTKSIS
eukprot:6207962-Pleurochrysis_carterae.AAC.3